MLQSPERHSQDLKTWREEVFHIPTKRRFSSEVVYIYNISNTKHHRNISTITTAMTLMVPLTILTTALPTVLNHPTWPSFISACARPYSPTSSVPETFLFFSVLRGFCHSVDYRTLRASAATFSLAMEDGLLR